MKFCMSKEPIKYIKHILDECSYLQSVIGNDISKDDFLQNETLKRAVGRSLELQEKPSKIPVDFKAKFSTIKWKSMLE